MPFKIIRNDITKMQVDAIVNPANAEPIYAAGADTAIYLAAGAEELLAERKKIGPMEEGQAAITPGFQLPAKYIIHAVSPCYIDGESEEEEKLRACYRNSLALAKEYGCESLAFPLIATGSFGYPKEEGMRIAVDEINAFLLHHEMLIYLVVFDTKSTELGLKLYPDLKAYIDHHYVCDMREVEYGDRYFNSIPSNAPEYDAYCQRRRVMERQIAPQASMPIDACAPKEAIRASKPRSVVKPGMLEEEDFLEASEGALKERIKHMSDTFQQYLLYLIQAKGMTNAEVYKRAIITKQTFSKIKLNPHYHPDKSTAMRLCIGARLSMDETRDLLARAGYALSPCDMRDVIFSYFIENKAYNMIEIDIVLEEYGLPCFIE